MSERSANTKLNAVEIQSSVVSIALRKENYKSIEIAIQRSLNDRAIFPHGSAENTNYRQRSSISRSRTMSGGKLGKNSPRRRRGGPSRVVYSPHYVGTAVKFETDLHWVPHYGNDASRPSVRAAGFYTRTV